MENQLPIPHIFLKPEGVCPLEINAGEDMHFQNTLYIQSFNNIHMTFTGNMDRVNIFPYILISLRQLIVITSDLIYS